MRIGTSTRSELRSRGMPWQQAWRVPTRRKNASFETQEKKNVIEERRVEIRFCSKKIHGKLCGKPFKHPHPNVTRCRICRTKWKKSSTRGIDYAPTHGLAQNIDLWYKRDDGDDCIESYY